MAGKLSVILVLFMVLNVDLARGRPSDEPTKIDLKLAETGVSESSPSRWRQGMDLLGRFEDELRIRRGKIVNSAMLTRNIIADRAEDFASETRNNVASVIAAKSDLLAQGSSAINSFVSSGPRETVKLENENAQGILEAKKENPIGNFLESYLRPTPLVDKIHEEDKYGNSGDKFIGIGRALVGGFEGLSNFLNTIVDLPLATVKKTSRGLSEALNQLGGRLVGLQ